MAVLLEAIACQQAPSRSLAKINAEISAIISEIMNLNIGGSEAVRRDDWQALGMLLNKFQSLLGEKIVVSAITNKIEDFEIPPIILASYKALSNFEKSSSIAVEKSSSSNTRNSSNFQLHTQIGTLDADSLAHQSDLHEEIQNLRAENQKLKADLEDRTSRLAYATDQSLRLSEALELEQKQHLKTKEELVECDDELMLMKPLYEIGLVAVRGYREDCKPVHEDGKIIKVFGKRNWDIKIERNHAVHRANFAACQASYELGILSSAADKLFFESLFGVKITFWVCPTLLRAINARGTLKGYHSFTKYSRNKEIDGRFMTIWDELWKAYHEIEKKNFSAPEKKKKLAEMAYSKKWLLDMERFVEQIEQLHIAHLRPQVK